MTSQLLGGTSQRRSPPVGGERKSVAAGARSDSKSIHTLTDIAQSLPSYHEQIKTWIRNALSGGKDVFAEVCEHIHQQSLVPCKTFSEFNTKSTKVKGDHFECFAQLYLKSVKGYQEAWRMAEVPVEVLQLMRLKR